MGSMIPRELGVSVNVRMGGWVSSPGSSLLFLTLDKAGLLVSQTSPQCDSPQWDSPQCDRYGQGYLWEKVIVRLLNASLRI